MPFTGIHTEPTLGLETDLMLPNLLPTYMTTIYMSGHDKFVIGSTLSM